MGIKWDQYQVALLTALIAVLPALLSFAYSIYKNGKERSDSNKSKQYELYHKLIQDLANNTNRAVDAQTAIAYELRYFRKYRKVTVRIFDNLLNNWENDEKIKIDAAGLIKEIKLSIESLNKRPLLWRIFNLYK